MVELVIENLTKRYGSATAVHDLSLHVADGEFVTLLGPSGCGKSTTLAAIAGLDRPDGGLIRSGDVVFFDAARGRDLPPEARNCGLVFQSYALWPHMTVEKNVAYPLKLRKVPRSEQRRRIEEVLDLVEMTAYADRYPHQLSGGQQQRVALARTLVYRPSVLLLDEPLSNLDAKLRERARAWLSELRTRVQLTTVYVTHDQLEALALSDRIAVMNGGHIAQLGHPREIYESPADPFVADFIGTSSFLRGCVEMRTAGSGEVSISVAGGTTMTASTSRDFTPGTPVVVALRPERLRIMATPEQVPGESGTLLPAKVVSKSYLGARCQYELEMSDIVAKVESADEIDGSEVLVWIPAHGCTVFERSRDSETAPPPKRAAS